MKSISVSKLDLFPTSSLENLYTEIELTLMSLHTMVSECWQAMGNALFLSLVLLFVYNLNAHADVARTHLRFKKGKKMS